MKSRLKWLFYPAFSLYLLFYVISVITIVRLPIFPTIDRVTFFGVVAFWTITGTIFYDLLVLVVMLCTASVFLLRWKWALIVSATAIVIVSLLAIDQKYSQFLQTLLVLVGAIPIILWIIGRWRNNGNGQSRFLNNDNTSDDWARLKLSLLVTFVFLEVSSSFRWILAVKYYGDLSSWTWKINNLENIIFYSFGLLSPYLLIMSLSSFAMRNYFNRIARFLLSHNQTENANTTFGNILERVRVFAIRHIPKSLQIDVVLVLLVAAVPSSLLCLFPYLLSGQVNDLSLGTDIPAYRNWINTLTLSSHNIFLFSHQLLSDLSEGDRPLSLLILYGSSLLFGDANLMLRYLPSILAPITVFAVFALVRFAYPENRRIAILAAIITAISHQVIIGFYAAFYANWMALIAILFSELFLLKTLQSFTRANIILFAILSFISLFLHSYTWSYYTIVVILFLIWSAIQRIRAKKSVGVIIVLGLITSAIIAFDLIKSYYMGASAGLDKDLSVAGNQTGIDEFARRWTNLNYAFRFYLGGALTNSLILLLVFTWTLIARYSNISDRLLLSSFFVALIPILFGDYVIQSRILYNIPLQIPAAIMMLKIYNYKSYGKWLFFALLFMQINYALRAMANMHLVLPT